MLAPMIGLTVFLISVGTMIVADFLEMRRLFIVLAVINATLMAVVIIVLIVVLWWLTLSGMLG
jgi:hypothetical protein